MTNIELLEIRKKLTDKVNFLRKAIDTLRLNDNDRRKVIKKMEEINKLVASIDEVDDILKQQAGK